MDEFRWQALFQRCVEPLFILNRQRRILFVNSAWEKLTGWTLAQVRRGVCRRRRGADPGSLEALLAVLAPPPEALEGRLVVVGETPPLVGQTESWEITFVPLRGEKGLLGLLGQIRLVPEARLPSGSPGWDLHPPQFLRERVIRRFQPNFLDFATPAGRRLAEQIRLAQQTTTPVLLVGERGTGKHWTARMIHHNGLAAGRPFVALDCRRLPGKVLEQALFGPAPLTAPGAAGSIYLQEPQYLPREVQGKLVGWLAACEAEVAGSPVPRLLAGCSTDPQEEIRAGHLLPDLYCGLAILTITLPPLRERQGELVPLVDRLLVRAAASLGRSCRGLTQEAWQIVRTASWPGNLRELYAALQSACARTEGELIRAEALPYYLRTSGTPPARQLDLKQILATVEKRLIVLALERSDHNKSRAAEMLSVWRGYLIRRIENLGLEDRNEP